MITTISLVLTGSSVPYDEGVSLACSQKAEGGFARRHNNERTIHLVPLASLDLHTRDRRVTFGFWADNQRILAHLCYVPMRQYAG